MSTTARRIMLALRDVRRVPRAALRKLAGLARATGASIELFHAVTESLDAAALRRAEAQLERIAHSPLLRGCKVHSAVAADAPAHEAIVRHALACRAELVVAVRHAHSRPARMFLDNTDWELIRHCPIPLLLIGSGGAYLKPVMLVAVDPLHAHAKPANLDERLLSAGARLSRSLGGALHIFHAYMPLVAHVQGPLGQPLAWESPELEDVHDEQVRSALTRLAERAKIPPERRHLVLGDVPGELAAAVRRLKASIVVMGAVSRTGVRRLLIGNTAERVLDRLHCDVLIIKPGNFKAAISRRAPRVISARAPRAQRRARSRK